jgi:hypothetical protein
LRFHKSIVLLSGLGSAATANAGTAAIHDCCLIFELPVHKSICL